MTEPLQVRRSKGTPADASGDQFFNRRAVLSALRCWWKVATPLGLLLSVAASAGVYLTFKPKYTAEVWLIIRDRQDHLLDGSGREDPRKFIANQIEMMRSPPVVNPVAAIPAVAKTPEIARDIDPIRALKRRVNIVARGQSEYFVVQFTSTSPHSAALVPNEIAKAYLELQRRTEGQRSNELIKLLNEELGQLYGIVQQARAAWYSEYKNALATAPDEVQASTRTTKLVAGSSVEAALQTQLTNAEVESMVVDVSIRFHETQPPSKPTPWDIEKYIQNDPEVKRLESIQAELEPKIQEYKSIATGPAARRQLLELEEKKKKSAEDLAREKESLVARVEADLEKAAQVQHESELLRLREKKAQLETLVRTLNDKLQDQQTKDESRQELKKAVGDTMFKVELLKSDYERAQQRYDLLKRRTETMGLEQRAPSRVDVYEYAAVPTMPDEAIPFKEIGMAAVVGFLLPFGLAIGIELLRRRVGSRDELESVSEIAVVGEVSMLPASVKRIAGRVERPSPELELFEESIDGLRTYLSLVQSLQGMQVLTVASSVSGEGKTTLSAQLALSMASAKGEPTLLIDGDIRAPDLHRVFDIECGPGLVDVLCGETPVEEAIATGFSDTLHVLPAGRLRTSPHRLMSNGEFAKLVDKLKGMYRYIVIDTPPILPASEALVMAQAGDATVLCVRRDYSRLAQVKEAYFRLQSAGVNTVGAVMNGIPSREYAYHYGSYYYACSRYETDAAQDQAS